MFVFIFIVLSMVVAFFLARFSMRDYLDKPPEKIEHAVFLVQVPGGIDEDFLGFLSRELQHSAAQRKGEVVMASLESLVKGDNLAQVVYGPQHLLKKLQQHYQLLELEEYLTKIDRKKVLAWEIEQVMTPEGTRVFNGKIESLFADLGLDDPEYFFLQAICSPVGEYHNFQVTLRGVVVGATAVRRSEISRKINDKMKTYYNLGKAKRRRTSLQVFEEFKDRLLVPKEVKKKFFDISELSLLFKKS